MTGNAFDTYYLLSATFAPDLGAEYLTDSCLTPEEQQRASNALMDAFPGSGSNSRIPQQYQWDAVKHHIVGGLFTANYSIFGTMLMAYFTEVGQSDAATDINSDLAGGATYLSLVEYDSTYNQPQMGLVDALMDLGGGISTFIDELF